MRPILEAGHRGLDGAQLVGVWPLLEKLAVESYHRQGSECLAVLARLDEGDGPVGHLDAGSSSLQCPLCQVREDAPRLRWTGNAFDVVLRCLLLVYGVNGDRGGARLHVCGDGARM